ncbi:MAG: hypothetical protein ACKPB8_00225, partial [Alphaproteobacteria bacterium]
MPVAMLFTPVEKSRRAESRYGPTIATAQPWEGTGSRFEDTRQTFMGPGRNAQTGRGDTGHMGLSQANRKFFLKISENNPRYSNQCRAAVITT